jgi:hypothetical protein
VVSGPENPNAFPMPGGYRGMTLRDWFAGQALSGLSALDDGPGATALFSMAKESSVSVSAILAAIAYERADAMLAERAKPDGAQS